MAHSIALFGCGRMGSALATGWLRASDRPALKVFDPGPGPLLTGWAAQGLIELNGPPVPADILVIAVKPQVYPGVLPQIAALADKNTLVLSIMAGVTLAGLRDTLKTDRIARAMPNTPGATGEGVTLLSVSDSLSSDDLATLRALLSPLGYVEGPMTERDLQVATTISGCGPAYVFHLVEAMASAGINQGLDPAMSTRIARQTVIGSGTLLRASDDTAEDLRRAVTSPGGVTAAALDILMGEGGFADLMAAAVVSALARDAALSGG